jgi:hypothetical protein
MQRFHWLAEPRSDAPTCSFVMALSKTEMILLAIVSIGVL